MKIDELTIGAHIRFRSRHDDNELTACHQVNGVNMFYMEVYADGEIYDIFDEKWNPNGFWEIVPIPLTSEILEKNGFGFQVGAGGLYQLSLKGINVRIDFNIIRYVHELQHAMRLCGIDKEIEL